MSPRRQAPARAVDAPPEAMTGRELADAIRRAHVAFEAVSRGARDVYDVARREAAAARKATVAAARAERDEAIAALKDRFAAEARERAERLATLAAADSRWDDELARSRARARAAARFAAQR